jgi:hypothetical protein
VGPNNSSCMVFAKLGKLITVVIMFSWILALYIKNAVTLFLQTLFPALVTPFQRHLESKQKVQWRPSRPGPPLNLLLALHMPLKGSYESLKGVCRNRVIYQREWRRCYAGIQDAGIKYLFKIILLLIELLLLMICNYYMFCMLFVVNRGIPVTIASPWIPIEEYPYL